MDNLMQAMPVERCGFVGKCQASPSGYASSVISYAKPSTDRVAQHALQQLEAARAKDVETHEKNQAAIENNKAVRAHIVAMMKAVGVPDSWSERDQTSRARFPKNKTVRAGYLNDIDRYVLIDDGFASATFTYESLKTRYDEYATRAKTEAEQAARERAAAEERKKEERRRDMALAGILLRYELPAESEWSDVLETLRSKNQRLDLAVAMQQTRGDWSEGPYRVSDALSRFTIETTEDKDIANDILSCLDGFEDGRTFRDTAWGYDRLFASVEDQQLAADVRLAASNVGD